MKNFSDPGLYCFRECVNPILVTDTALDATGLLQVLLHLRTLVGAALPGGHVHDASRQVLVVHFYKLVPVDLPNRQRWKHLSRHSPPVSLQVLNFLVLFLDHLSKDRA